MEDKGEVVGRDSNEIPAHAGAIVTDVVGSNHIACLIVKGNSLSPRVCSSTEAKAGRVGSSEANSIASLGHDRRKGGGYCKDRSGKSTSSKHYDCGTGERPGGSRSVMIRLFAIDGLKLLLKSSCSR